MKTLVGILIGLLLISSNSWAQSISPEDKTRLHIMHEMEELYSENDDFLDCTGETISPAIVGTVAAYPLMIACANLVENPEDSQN